MSYTNTVTDFQTHLPISDVCYFCFIRTHTHTPDLSSPAWNKLTVPCRFLPDRVCLQELHSSLDELIFASLGRVV